MVNEVQTAQSKKDFISKMSIVAKETRETHYWINLLIETDCLNINDTYVKLLFSQYEELIKPLTGIIKTSQSNL